MPEPVRIAHILPWATIGGVERATVHLAELLREHGYQNLAYCLPGALYLAEVFRAAGFDTSTYEGAWPSFRHPAAFLKASWALARNLRRRRVQLVHCSDLLAGYYGAWAAQLARIPSV